MPRLLGFSVGEYVKALECAKAYLLLHPDDEDVLDNVDYYEGLLDGSTDPASIKAREVRPMSEKKLFILLGALGRAGKNIAFFLKIANDGVKVLRFNSF